MPIYSNHSTRYHARIILQLYKMWFHGPPFLRRTAAASAPVDEPIPSFAVPMSREGLDFIPGSKGLEYVVGS